MLATLDFYREVVPFCRKHDIWIIVRPRLCRDLFRRRRIAALDPAGARARWRSRSSSPRCPRPTPCRLADGVRGRQPAAGLSTRADEVLPRLRRLHPDPGGRHGGAERPAGLRGGDAGAVSRAARRADTRPRRQAGWHVPSPEGSMFAWAPIPPRHAHLGSGRIRQAPAGARANVAVAPGLGFGEHGDGHVRIGLVENPQRLRQAIRNIRALPAACRQQRGRGA